MGRLNAKLLKGDKCVEYSCRTVSVTDRTGYTEDVCMAAPLSV